MLLEEGVAYFLDELIPLAKGVIWRRGKLQAVSLQYSQQLRDGCPNLVQGSRSGSNSIYLPLFLTDLTAPAGSLSSLISTHSGVVDSILPLLLQCSFHMKQTSSNSVVITDLGISSWPHLEVWIPRIFAIIPIRRGNISSLRSLRSEDRQWNCNFTTRRKKLTQE